MTISDARDRSLDSLIQEAIKDAGIDESQIIDAEVEVSYHNEVGGRLGLLVNLKYEPKHEQS